MADYVHVGDIIEQERLRRQVQIAKGVNPDVVDHIEKAVQNDSFQSDMESNLSRFADDISGFDKAETEFLLSKLQRQLNADSGSVLLKSMQTIALQHMNNIEKADEGRAVGETKQINGKTYIWTEYAPGKFDWHISEKRGKQEQPQGNKQAKNPEAPNGPQGNKPADVSSHAKEASTDALKRAAADNNAAPEVRQAAKKELESRGGSGRMVDKEGRLNKNHPDAQRFAELDKRWDDKETRKKMSKEEIEELYSLNNKRRLDIAAFEDEENEERRKKGEPVLGNVSRVEAEKEQQRREKIKRDKKSAYLEKEQQRIKNRNNWSSFKGNFNGELAQRLSKDWGMSLKQAYKMGDAWDEQVGGPIDIDLKNKMTATDTKTGKSYVYSTFEEEWKEVRKVTKQKQDKEPSQQISDIFEEMDNWSDDDWMDGKKSGDAISKIEQLVADGNISEKDFYKIKPNWLDMSYEEVSGAKVGKEKIESLIDELDNWSEEDFMSQSKNRRWSDDLSRIIKKHNISEEQFNKIAEKYPGYDLVYEDYAK